MGGLPEKLSALHLLYQPAKTMERKTSQKPLVPTPKSRRRVVQMAAEPRKMVRLRSSDGETFEVEEKSVCAASRTIKGMLTEEGRGAGDVVPLPNNVTADTLSRVLDYVREHYSHREFYFPISGHDHPLVGFD